MNRNNPQFAITKLVLYRVGYDFKRLFTISEYYDGDRSAFICKHFSPISAYEHYSGT